MTEVHSCIRVFYVDKYHCLMADPYDLRAHSQGHDLTDAAGRDQKLAERHRHTSASIKSAILDLFWGPDRVSFYDYNLTASARGTFYSPATFWPFWNDIIPCDVLMDENKAMQAFSALRI
jgi:alpha,alpha-trehalase